MKNKSRKRQFLFHYHCHWIMLVLLFCCSSYTSQVSAQSLQKEISLESRNEALSSVLKKVEKASGFKILFTYDEVQDYKITASLKSKPVSTVLKTVFNNTPFKYSVKGKFIYVTRNQASVSQSHGGKKSLTGRVLDEEGVPLIGVTVRVKGTGTGTVTNYDGEFEIPYEESSAMLTFSYLGKEDTETRVTAGNPAKITLADSESATRVNEVVVIGYGSMKKRDLTGSVISISDKVIENKSATSVFDALQGSAPGVQVVSGSGQPGESASIKIRGTSTFSAEGVTPLYIVDGAPLESLDGINTNDIVSMEVLKDAASAAIYGSRSANGVIIITTKSGQEGKPVIDIKYNHSWGTLSHKVPQANRMERLLYDQFRKSYFESYGGGNPNESSDVLDDPYNYFYNVDNDYLDMITKTGNKDQIDVSLSGGTSKLKYFINTGYYNENGIIDNTGFRRISTRVNSDYAPNKWLNIGSRISLTYSKKNGLNEGRLLSSVLSRRPYFNTYYSDGSMVGVFNGQKNPMALIEYTTDFTDSYKMNFFQFGVIRFNKYLKFRTNLNFNFYLDKRKQIEPSLITDEWQKSNKGFSYNHTNWNWMNENYLTYERKLGQHHFQAMVGMSLQRWHYENENLVGINSSNDYIYTLNAFSANLDLSKTRTFVSNHALASVFGRVTYDYKSRYLFAANFRRDGSSRFSKDNRYGNFPSVSLGWRFSDEKFLKGMKNVLTDGKLRASFGITGNQSIGNYDYVYTYSPSTIYDGVGGIAPTRIGTEHLKWEETKQFDLGLDLNFWNNRLVVNADYYYKYTDGLLANYQLPKESGFSYMKTNVGEISNQGFEISVSGDLIRSKDWTWNTTFNLSRNISRIEKLQNGKAYMEGDIWWMEEGGNIGDFYGFKSNGIFQYDESNAFTKDWKQLTPVFEDGVFQYKYLLNGSPYTGDVHKKTLPNGKAFRGGDYNWIENPESQNGVIDDNDRMVIGNALPNVTGGFNTTVQWKDLSLYVGMYFSLGGKIYNYAEHNRNQFKYMGTTPSPEVIYNLWLQPGDEAIYPRPFNDEFNNARIANSFYLEDASFVRLQNIRLSYHLPKMLMQKIFLKDLSLYAFANNVLTWTDYSGFDPEFSTNNPLQIGKDTYRYPRKREFGLGFIANF